jgi:hypothetical protein
MHVLQSTKQEVIWNAGKAGDEALLQQCLDGATIEDFNFEKMDDEVSRCTGVV